MRLANYSFLCVETDNICNKRLIGIKITQSKIKLFNIKNLIVMIRLECGIPYFMIRITSDLMPTVGISENFQRKRFTYLHIDEPVKSFN